MNDCIEHSQNNKRGYGNCKYKGVRMTMHRRAYIIHKGPIPPGLLVRHTCDNPKCINPEHLILGTQLDNMRDKFERGRHVKKPDTFPPEALQDILTSKDSQKEIGDRYGLTQSAISKIRTRYRARGGAY